MREDVDRYARQEGRVQEVERPVLTRQLALPSATIGLNVNIATLGIAQ